MTITLEEALDFGNKWFSTVLTHTKKEDLEGYFLNPDPHIYNLDKGEAISVQMAGYIHTQLINEVHDLRNFTITKISDKPERVRLIGSTYWEGTYKKDPSKVIRSLVGEDWIIERTDEGLKFVMYLHPYFELFPESAPLDFEEVSKIDYFT